MFCSNCGNKLSDGAKFCSECGSPVNPINNIPTESTASIAPSQTEVRPMPEYPMTLNGITFNAVEVALKTNLYEKRGLMKDQETIELLKEITGAGSFKTSSVVHKMREDASLKLLVTSYQTGTPVTVTVNNDDGQLRCPNCNSTQIEIDKQGFSGTKALVGGLLTGGIGIAAGWHNKNKRIGKCLKCGHSWKI